MKFKQYKEWKIPESATKAAPGIFSGVYFYMEGKWYFGSRPDHYYQEVCKSHTWDINERVQGGVIDEV
ncbi:DUF7274 domain-containing protein [Escherichia coli]|uniref:DUF7274 domain-containing protein n=1 Tax=Escherichia coli TaxID=562 RepID=UPI000A39B6AB|nr:hypothetical protein [Escherichia coli]AVU66279.1 hypothetical protein A9X72_14060 [Escherichia coli]EFA3675370.1 hypothetical protein [Escherichia coli]EFE5092181.1 hypothetical protein [Escherichia coli]EFO7931400.1 hypothetical protein [Escherichia coli]ELT0778703.1 hypothetical protein [Escherichia coli]